MRHVSSFSYVVCTVVIFGVCRMASTERSAIAPVPMLVQVVRPVSVTVPTALNFGRRVVGDPEIIIAPGDSAASTFALKAEGGETINITVQNVTGLKLVRTGATNPPPDADKIAVSSPKLTSNGVNIPINSTTGVGSLVMPATHTSAMKVGATLASQVAKNPGGYSGTMSIAFAYTF